MPMNQTIGSDSVMDPEICEGAQEIKLLEKKRHLNCCFVAINSHDT